MNHSVPTKPLPGKGQEGERCNRTACQKPHSAHYFNTAMNAWYCEGCARDIEDYAVKHDHMSFFPRLAEERASRAPKEGRASA